MKEIFVNFDEFAEMECEYDMEDCGMSGRHIDYHWFVAKNIKTGEELQVYVK